jgi:hypothetical protein
VQRIAVRIILVLLTLLLSSCSLTSNNEFASFRIGSDSFDSRKGVFKRSLCLENQENVEVALPFTKSEKQKLFRFAKQDIRDGNAGLIDLEKICVSSYPYEIKYGDSKGEIKTTCFSPLQDDEAQLSNFVYAIEAVQNLPKSNCRLY